jgi:thiol-disulfide isomerase/thioredoxin
LKKTILTVSLALLVASSVYTMVGYNKNNNESKLSTYSPAESKPSAGTTSGSKVNPQAVKIKSADFTLGDLNGKEVTLSSLKGKKVMLNFFTTWCPPCKAEMPDMEKLYQETKDSDLIILAVNLGEDEATVKEFMKKNNYNFPVLLDSKGSTADKYSVSAIPTTYFLDKEGSIVPFNDITLGKTVTRKQGAMTLEEMRAYIKNLN